MIYDTKCVTLISEYLDELAETGVLVIHSYIHADKGNLLVVLVHLGVLRYNCGVRVFARSD